MILLSYSSNKKEQETGLEPATSTLGKWDSTIELLLLNLLDAIPLYSIVKLPIYPQLPRQAGEDSYPIGVATLRGSPFIPISTLVTLGHLLSLNVLTVRRLSEEQFHERNPHLAYSDSTPLRYIGSGPILGRVGLGFDNWPA